MKIEQTIASGCYPRYPSQVVWTGDPPPNYPYCPSHHYPLTPPRPWTAAPSIQEQLGIDPVSKLATAIERLAAAIEGAER
jgi:hypothetical protein